MVDNTIALQVRPFQMPDVGQIYGQAQTLQANRMRMEEAQETARERNALRGLMASGVDLNTPEGLNQLRRAAPMLAPQFEQRNLEGARIRAQTAQYGARAEAEALKVGRDLFAAATTPEQYGAARSYVAQRFPQYANSIPAEFSVENARRIAEGAEGLIRRATAGAERAPDEFTRMLGHAGFAPGSPEAQALARGYLERRGTPPSTVVNMPQIGSIPPGYEVVRDDQGRVNSMRPIPGSPAAIEAERAAAATGVRTEATKQTGATVIGAIDRAEEIMRTSALPTTGFLGERFANIGGTGARDLAGSLNTIRANIGFDQLNQMRQASPTGGALGNVSNQEIAYLQAVLGDLGQSQSAGELQRNLRRMRDAYDEIVNYGLGKRPPVQIPGPGGRGTAEPPPRDGVPDARRPAAGATPAAPGEFRTPGGAILRPLQ
jgi:hypothetical protein